MSKKRKFVWQIYLLVLVMIVAALVSVLVYASHTFRAYSLKSTRESLEAHAEHFRFFVSKSVATRRDWPEIDALCKSVGETIDIRLTVILPSGEVLGDSREDPARMENHADRPEIQAALAGTPGLSSRYSYTLDQDMMYVAVPITSTHGIIGVVRTSTPVTLFKQTLHQLYFEMMLGAGVIALLAAIMSLFISKYLTKPLQQIREGALRYAAGDLQHRIRVPVSEEASVLAETMNQMAAQLAERIQTVTRQRNELEAVLANMVEAVITVDRDERIVRCNNAAAGLFHLPSEKVSLRSLQEMIRNAGIQRFVKKAFETGSPVEDVLSLGIEHERFLHVHGTLLPKDEGQMNEALFVFHDITRLKQLENMRKEFVANVSHELRTPITSITGFVETLLDGAIAEPEHAQKFLKIIDKNAQRLNSIIGDLLTLSKIEQGNEGEQMVRTRGRVKDVLESASLICENRAAALQMSVTLDCPESLWITMNAPLLEQAVVNLLENAIKYSERGASIKVTAKREAHECVIAVKDTGCGIAREHLTRLFERFYRVDKARSRQEGGTGLGLAIVKHIATAHGGRATVQSAPGIGSTFSICLPTA